MAYTDITSTIISTSTGATISGAGSIKLENAICSPYGFAASGAQLASQNLNINSSCASMRLTFTKTGSTGVNIRLMYMVQSENNYDYAMFVNSGTSVTSGVSYSDSRIYAHTHGSNYTTAETLVYYLPSSSFIDILYRKDSSTHTGWDRLFVAVSAEGSNGGGGGSNPGTSIYWYIATKVRPCGIEQNGSGIYVLPTTATTGYTMHLGMGLGNDFEGDMEIVTTGNHKIGWISGVTTDTGVPGSASIGEQTSLVFDFDGVYGHSDVTTFGAYAIMYTGTAVQIKNHYTTTESLTVVDVVHYQYDYSVGVMTDSSPYDYKAYYTVAYGPPFNVSYVTGKSGRVHLYSSATTGTVEVTISRSGSTTVSRSRTRPEAILIVSPTSGSSKIVTTNDLWAFDSALGNSYSSVNYKCLKYDSSIFHTGVGEENKLMLVHDFLYFTGTPDEFNSQGGGSTYSVTANTPITVTWTNSSLITVNLTEIYISATADGGPGSLLYSMVQSKMLTGNSTGSFIVQRTLTGATDVNNLVVGITVTNYASVTVGLQTQSGTIGVGLNPSYGEATETVLLSSDITITGITLSIHDAQQ